jgi:predicted DNA-binding transcriptional regulator AlpA
MLESAPDRLLSIEEMRNRIFLSRRQIYKLVAAGKLAQPLKQGSRVAWTEQAFVDYIASLKPANIGKGK